MVVNRFKTMGGRSGGGSRGGSGRSSGGGGRAARSSFASMTRNEIANTLTAAGSISRWNNNSSWDRIYNDSWAMLTDAAKTDTFGGKIAKEIIDRTTAAEKKYKKQLGPRVSPKQAWAIANALSTK